MPWQLQESHESMKAHPTSPQHLALQAVARALQTAQRSEAYFAEYRKHHSIVEPDANGQIVRRYPDGRSVVLRKMRTQ